MRSIGLIVYVVIGVAVAAAQDYLGDVGSIGDIVNLLLAVLLWPLVLLGVDFNLDIGGGRNGKGENKNGALLLLAAPLAYARSALGSTRKLALERRMFGSASGVGVSELAFLRKRCGRFGLAVFAASRRWARRRFG
jgi:hypothetical protein